MNSLKFFDLQKMNLTRQKEIEEAIIRTVQSGWYIFGEAVERFEKSFAAYCGVKLCIGASNRLDILILF